MSPVSPAVAAPASLSGVFGLLGMPSGFVDIIDFNGTATQLPLLTGPDKVGVHHFTIKHDLESRFYPPAACNDANASLPQLHEQYGEDGVLYIIETCSGLRHIPVSVFYPACVDPQEPQLKGAPVFTQSLLDTVTAQVFRDTDSMHNMESQAFLDAPACPDKYPMIILSPPVGGQRQAYTQLASDIASYHHVVVTVDHAFQSGAIELENGNVLFNLAGELIKPREANAGRVVDLMAVAMHFNDSSNLDQLPWASGTEIDLLNTYVFGHGQGGLIARMLVASNLLSAGGTLDNLIRMAAPYDKGNVLFKPRHNHTSTKKPQLTPEPELGSGNDSGNQLPDIVGEIGNNLGERLKNMVRGLRKTMMDSFSILLCRVFGTCGTIVQKRELTKMSHDHEDWGDHEGEPCDDLCFFPCRLECKPNVPHGLFPDNLGKSAGKTHPDDGDWSDDWTDYGDNIGDYQGFPGRNPYRQHEKSCYDDDYCYEKCCYKKHHHEDDHDWEDEHEDYGHDHENREDDRDRQDQGRVPDQWRDEDDAPSSGQNGSEKSPAIDRGDIEPSEDENDVPDDEKDSPDEDSSDDEDGLPEDGLPEDGLPEDGLPEDGLPEDDDSDEEGPSDAADSSPEDNKDTEDEL